MFKIAAGGPFYSTSWYDSKATASTATIFGPAVLDVSELVATANATGRWRSARCGRSRSSRRPRRSNGRRRPGCSSGGPGFTPSRGLELDGTVASRAAGETVEALAKDCGPGQNPYRLLAGTRTLAGGVWRVGQEAGLPAGPSGSSFRARWQGHFSEPALVRYPAGVTATWRPGKRIVIVAVSTWFSGQSVRGRFVELQRRVESTGQWVRVRRARLGRGRYWRGSPPGQVFTTQFSVPTRRLTLRVFVPQQTATACFSAGVSVTWRS